MDLGLKNLTALVTGSTVTEGVRKFVKEVFPDLPQEAAEKRFIMENRSTSLIQRFIRPEEIADAVAFVASPKASSINGAAVRVDGGLVRHIV